MGTLREDPTSLRTVGGYAIETQEDPPWRIRPTSGTSGMVREFGCLRLVGRNGAGA